MLYTKGRMDESRTCINTCPTGTLKLAFGFDISDKENRKKIANRESRFIVKLDKEMGRQVKLLHSVHKFMVENILKRGLKAASEYDDLELQMRFGVVYCWLRKEHDKLSSGGQRADYVYVEVSVDEDRCRVADMDFASIAMMYRQGSRGKPKNEEAARLLAEVYRVTSVPLSDYTERMFGTPEVLVAGDIESDCITRIED